VVGLRNANLSNDDQVAQEFLRKFFLTFFLKKVIFSHRIFHLEKKSFTNNLYSIIGLARYLEAAVHHVQ
jgi:hypothetical protein